MSWVHREIDSLKQEIERLRRSSSFQTPIQTPSRPYVIN